MSDRALRQHAVDAMAAALRKRDDVLAAITAVDGGLGARMAVLNDVSQTLTELRDPDDGRQETALRVGRGQVAELMAYCAAAVARRSGLDDGLPALAETWLDALSEVMRVAPVAVVIPSQQEFTDVATQVINLKIPFEGVWGLTVAVHEYGHFLASLLTTRADLKGVPLTTVSAEAFLGRYEREHPDGRPYYRHGHELVADAVAVLLSGPAFSHHCLGYRFDVARSDGYSTTHPRYARRMHVQLRVLEHMGKDDEWMARAQKVVAARWAGLVAADAAAVHVDGSADRQPDDGMEEVADFAVTLACTHPTLQRGRYRDHGAAVRLADQGFARSSSRPSYAHVMNAAWSARLKRGESAVAAIEAAARPLLSEAGGDA